MNTHLNKHRSIIRTISLFAILIWIFSACKKDDDLTIGSNFLESQTNVVLIDTFSVCLSTVVLDSFPTHGDSLLLIGSINDANVGKIRCSTFFQLGKPTETTLKETDEYDSITLKLTYSGYSYGDTNQLFSIAVHRLSEEPAESENLYNTSSINYYTTTLGTHSFYPQPTSNDTIEFRLDDALGLDLFNKMMNKNDVFSTTTDFLEYFNGLAILPDENINSSIVSFIAKGASLSMKLYIHRFMEVDYEVAYDFPIIYNELQFNKIYHDFSGTGLENFVQQRFDIASAETGNKSYLFGGAGLMVKIKFPAMQELLNSERGAILKTELTLFPEINSSNGSSLPAEVVLYHSDKYNKFGDGILSLDGKSLQIANFLQDKFYNEYTSYTFDLTSYFISEFSDGYFDSDHSLVLSLPESKYATTFERLDVGSKSPAPRLKIYYVHY